MSNKLKKYVNNTVCWWEREDVLASRRDTCWWFSIRELQRIGEEIINKEEEMVKDDYIVPTYEMIIDDQYDRDDYRFSLWEETA